MTELSPDVRDRAAQALRDSFNPPAIMSWDELCDESREMWRGHVDAVAEVLAAGMAEEVKFLRAERELYRSEGLKIQAERDALKARVAELSTQHLHLSHEVEALEEWNFWLSRTLRDMARRATSLRRLTDFAVTAPEPRADRDALKARVDLLTTALTDVEQAVAANATPGLRALVTQRVRAVLSATPTESEAPPGHFRQPSLPLINYITPPGPDLRPYTDPPTEDSP